MLQTGLTYLIILMSGLAQNLDTKNKTNKKWNVIIVIVFFLIELELTINDTDSPDFLDFILPSLTIAERNEIFKLIMISALKLLSKFLTIFFENKED